MYGLHTSQHVHSNEAMRKNPKNARVGDFSFFHGFIFMGARLDFCDFFQHTHSVAGGRASTIVQEFWFLRFFRVLFYFIWNFYKKKFPFTKKKEKSLNRKLCHLRQNKTHNAAWNFSFPMKLCKKCAKIEARSCRLNWLRCFMECSTEIESTRSIE